MSLTVLDPGLSTTVQDLGRDGYRDQGVPPGGAFDAEAAQLANALLGNRPSDAVLEMALKGGRFRADVPLAVALAGGEVEIKVQRALGSWTTFTPPVAIALGRDDEISVGWVSRGARVYLAVLGGVETEMILGSRSSEERLAAGTQLACWPGRTPVRHVSIPAVRAEGEVLLRVIEGPDAGEGLGPRIDPGAAWQVDPRSDRMGIRLVGPRWDLEADPNRLSSPVCPGAVQVAGEQPLILGVAAGTMGGYPHVLTVIAADLAKLGQLRPGDSIQFRVVTIGEARRLGAESRRARRRLFDRIATACRDGSARLDATPY